MDFGASYWLSFWKYVFITGVMLLTLLIGSCQMTRYRIVQAIEAGADPMIASCALNNQDVHGACVAYSLIEKENKQ